MCFAIHNMMFFGNSLAHWTIIGFCFAQLIHPAFYFSLYSTAHKFIHDQDGLNYLPGKKGNYNSVVTEITSEEKTTSRLGIGLVLLPGPV